MTRTRAGQLALGAFALAFLVVATVTAHWRPLWFDELFTFEVARQPSTIATLRALLAGADTNPPLDYVLRHISMALLGEGPVGFRLPSVLALLVGCWATWGFVRPRVPPLAAACAFVLPFGTAAAYFASEGRAYALLFAAGPIALLAWQRAMATDRRAGHLVLLALALCVGPYSHYFGVLALLPVAAGEAWRSIVRRRVDTGIVAAFVGAGLLCTLLLPIARLAMGMKAAFWAAGFTFDQAWHYYGGFLAYGSHPAIIVIIAGIVVLLAVLATARREIHFDVPGHELAAAVVLTATPLTGYLLAVLVTGALTPRYAIGLVPGIAMLAAYLLGAWPRRRVFVLAQMTVVAWLVVTSLVTAVAAARKVRSSVPIPSDVRALLRQTALPIAFDSPHAYLEYVHYAPELANRFVYPMDAATGLRWRGFNNDEIALRGLARVAKLDVRDYDAFVGSTPEFLVVSTNDFMPALVPALRADGVCFRTLGGASGAVVLYADRYCR